MAKSYKRTPPFSFVVGVSFFMLFAYISPKAQIQSAKIFARLRTTAELRARLTERFNTFLEYERTKQYERQFDLIASEGLSRGGTHNLTRDEFVKEKRLLEKVNGELLDLKVRSIDRKLSEGGYVAISVRAKLRKDGREYFDEPIMLAFFKNGEWYFTLTYFDV